MPTTQGSWERDRHYAIAARDGVDLFLVLHIKRNWKGEFVPMWRGHERPWDDPCWNPHATYHALGELHQKASAKCTA
jgi:hypothetical protein